MSSEYYGSYDISAAQRARIAAEREHELAEQRRREEALQRERRRLAEIADGRERDAVASRFSNADGEWRQAILLDRLAALTAVARMRGDAALVRRCESLRNTPGDLAELEKKIEAIGQTTDATPSRQSDDRTKAGETSQRVAVILRNLPPEIERAFASQLKRIRSIVAEARDVEALRWVDLTMSNILQQAPAICARHGVALTTQRRKLNSLLDRTRAVAALANSVVANTARELVELIDNATSLEDAVAAGLAVDALGLRVDQLEFDFGTAHDAEMTRDYVMNAVAEVLNELGYSPIVGSAPVESVDALARAAFVTPDGEVVEAKVAVGGQARFDFKARDAATSQDELVQKCATWCAEFEGVRTELAARGVYVHEVLRVAPGKKPIAATALPLPREARTPSRRRRKRNSGSTQERKA
jgi:hypothetical protein